MRTGSARLLLQASPPGFCGGAESESDCQFVSNQDGHHSQGLKEAAPSNVSSGRGPGNVPRGLSLIPGPRPLAAFRPVGSAGHGSQAGLRTTQGSARIPKKPCQATL